MFQVVLTDSAREDLSYLKKGVQTVILDAIEKQLALEPLKPTRNRKPLRTNSLAAWEVRVGSHRVLYDVDEAENQVLVKAVGWKEHNKLYFRGKELLS